MRGQPPSRPGSAGTLAVVNIVSEVRALHGVASIEQLRSLGIGPGLVRHARRTGRIITVRRGWVALPDAPQHLVRAVRIGGRLGCVSAAEVLGLWTPGTSSIHAAVPKHSGRVDLSDRDILVHWRSARWGDNPFAVESVPDVLRQVAVCLEREDAVAVIDSALHRKLATRSMVRAALAGLPSRAALLEHLDERAESGTESVCRFRLRNLGLALQVQAEIDGVGRVDLLIGRRLVIEVDSKRWHDDPNAFERDRARDLALARLGYRVVRLSYLQVMFGWPEAEAAILALVARGEHR